MTPHPQVHRLSTRPLTKSEELRVEQEVKVSQESAVEGFLRFTIVRRDVKQRIRALECPMATGQVFEE